jgi:hypothetical protein
VLVITLVLEISSPCPWTCWISTANPENLTRNFPTTTKLGSTTHKSDIRFFILLLFYQSQLIPVLFSLICLPVCIFVHMSACHCVWLSVCVPVCLCTCLPVYLSACAHVYLSTCLPVNVPACLHVCLLLCLPVYLSACLYMSA